MAIYRQVLTSFWTDPKVDDEFTPEDKYFYLYLMTNPHTNICGCYEIGRKAIERETGYTWDSIQRLLTRMQDVHGVIRYSPDTKEILIMNWGKYNWSTSCKLRFAVAKNAKDIRNDEFREYVLVTLGNTGIDDTKRDSEKKKVPSLEEVEAYVQECGYNFSAQLFLDYYMKRGWQTSSGPINDWRRLIDACSNDGSFRPIKIHAAAGE